MITIERGIEAAQTEAIKLGNALLSEATHDITLGVGDSVASLVKNLTISVHAFDRPFEAKNVKTGAKDGPHYMQGAMDAADDVLVPRGGPMRSMWGWVFDIDSGQDPAPVAERIRAAGVGCWMHTTHSHGKTSITDLDYEDFTGWREHNNRSEDIAAVGDWLREARGWNTGAAATVIDFAANGDAMLVKLSKPFPKSRVVIPASREMDADPVAWKRCGAVLGKLLQIEYDPAVARERQPIYWPRKRNDGAPYEAAFIDGVMPNPDTLLALAEQMGITAETVSRRTNVPREQAVTRRKAADLTTAGDDEAVDIVFDLFWPRFKRDVDMVMLGEMNDISGTTKDVKNREGAAAQLFEGACCYAHEWRGIGGHSDPDKEGRPMMLMSAWDAPHGHPVAQCFHTHCQEIPARLFARKLLDGIEPERWGEVLGSEAAQERFKAWFASLPKTPTQATSRAVELVEALGEDPSEEDVDAACAAVAAMPDNARRVRLVRALGALPGYNREEIKRLIRAYETSQKNDREQAAGRAADFAREENRFNDAIPVSEDFDQLCAGTRAQFEKYHADKPTVFKDEGGGLVRLGEKLNKKGQVMTCLQGLGDVVTPAWSAELAKATRHVRWDEDNERWRVTACPSEVKSVIVGSNDLRFPHCASVSTIPLHGPDGTLITKQGYVPGLRTYFAPGTTKFKAVRARPTDAEVNKALEGVLRELLRDFPFTDRFDGSERLPVRYTSPGLVDVYWRDGVEIRFPRPVRHRGRGSWANALGMLITPLATHLHEGPAPLFAITKPNPGEGGGYLADIPHIMLTDAQLDAVMYNPNDEEMEKKLGAKLREKQMMLTLDNIRDRVDSPIIASAATSGSVSVRILGTSNTVSLPLPALTLLIGINLSFTREIGRRIVPIMLDAGLPDPAADRDEATFYAHKMPDYTREMRTELIWSIQTLIQNWLVQGRPDPRHGRVLASFSGHSRAVGGILDAAGQPHYLANLDAFRASLTSDTGGHGGIVAAVHAWWDQFSKQGREFSTSEALDAITDGGVFAQRGGTVRLKYDLAIKDPTPATMGKFMASHAKGSTFNVEKDPTQPHKLVKLFNRFVDGSTKWRLEAV